MGKVVNLAEFRKKRNTPKPAPRPRLNAASTDEVMAYMRDNPLATVAEAQRAIARRKGAAAPQLPCERCQDRGFSGLSERHQNLGSLLGRDRCPRCGRA